MERRVGLFVLLQSLREMIQHFLRKWSSPRNVHASVNVEFLKLINTVLFKGDYHYSYDQIQSMDNNTNLDKLGRRVTDIWQLGLFARVIFKATVVHKDTWVVYISLICLKQALCQYPQGW